MRSTRFWHIIDRVWVIRAVTKSVRPIPDGRDIRPIGVSVLAVLFGAALAACSGGEASPDPGVGGVSGQAGSGAAGSANGGSPNAGGLGAGGGAAGASGSAGTAGASGGGGTAPVSSSLLAVCTRYIQSECQRLYDCALLDNDLASCTSSAQSCPDFLFAPGTTRTVDNTIACIEAWKTFSCNDLAIGKAPSCATEGTRAAGEKCVYDLQCASGDCNSQIGLCGTCAELAAPGGACSTPDVYCPDGQTCSQGACVDNVPVTVIPRAPAAAGAPCTRSSTCPSGYFCSLDTTSQTDGHCTTLPQVGSHCGFDAWGAQVCASSLYCEGTTCSQPPALGEACTTTCQPDGFCATGTCKPRLAVGGLCFVDRSDSQSSCRAGLQCFCNDVQCQAGTCYEPLVEGAPCGDSQSHCIAGTACTNGVCVSGDGTARFTGLCGPP